MRNELVSDWCRRGEGDEEEGVGGLDKGEGGEGWNGRAGEGNGG